MILGCRNSERMLSCENSVELSCTNLLMMSLRRILGYRWHDYMCNDLGIREAGLRQVTCIVRERQLRLYGVCRHNENPVAVSIYIPMWRFFLSYGRDQNEGNKSFGHWNWYARCTVAVEAGHIQTGGQKVGPAMPLNWNCLFDGLPKFVPNAYLKTEVIFIPLIFEWSCYQL